jgi:hemolysin III
VKDIGSRAAAEAPAFRTHNKRAQTAGEEIANAITHGIGVVLSVAALALLVVFASLRGDAWRIVGFSIYGSTLVLLYLASTLYHSFSAPRLKRFFYLLDHSSINLLIAGTYTPVTLVTLRGVWGWILFGLIWGLAILGILRDLLLPEKRGLAVAVYIAMGWLAVIVIEPILRLSDGYLLLWMLIGGVCYTLGVFFYAWKSLKYHHMIWHLFVLAGSITHFFGILFHISPRNP